MLRHNPANPDWPGRDRFVLSAGHACILQYAALHLSGYDLTLDDLKQFRQWESRTPGHPEHFMTPGVETTTGPLGQGFANGVGMAIAERFLAERYNRPAPRARRPPDLRDLLRRRPDGRGLAGGGVDRRATSASAASSTSTTTTTSRSTARRRSPSRPRTRASASRRTAGTSSTWPTARTSTRSRPRCARRRGRAGAAVADRRPQPHRVPRAARAGHRQGARLAPRRGGGAGDEGASWAGIPTSTSTSRTRCASTWPPSPSAAPSSSASGSERFARLGGGLPRGCAPSGTPTALGSRARAGCDALPWFEAGEELATRDAGKKVHERDQRVRRRR